jgi:hypothetical protein
MMDLNVKIDDSEFNISNNVDDKEEIEIKVSKYDHNKKTELVRRINKIKKKEYIINIFKIITASNNDYTVNTNGVYIFFHNLEDDVYERVEAYVNNIYKLHRKNSSLKSILSSELSDSMLNMSETINDNSDTNELVEKPVQTIQQTKDISKQLSNKEKMIIKRKKYEEYLTQNQNQANV